MSIISKGGRVTTSQPRGREQGPTPGMLDTIGASFRLAEDEQELTQAPRNAEAYQGLLDSLGDLGVDTRSTGKLYRDETSSIPGALGTYRIIDRDAIFAEVERQRARNPKLFAAVPKTREEYDQSVATRGGARAADQATAQRGGLTGQLIGGFASGMTDPYNLATLPAGAGQASLVRTMLVESLLGGATELPNLSSTERAKARMGEDYTAGDMAKQVALSAGASGILGGALRGAELASPKIGGAIGSTVDATRARLETIVAERWDSLPEAVRTRWAKGADIADVDLPDLAETLLGRENMSVDERAAVAALRRNSEVAEASPFKRGMAGDEAHRVRLDETLAALLQPVTRAPRAFASPVRPDMAAPSRADLASGTSLSSGASSPRGALKARIARVESGGNDSAKNPLSSATGRYQFVSDTWLRYYKRRFGSQGQTDAQILGKRGDTRLQETLMDDLTADNAAFLRTVGEAETAGNLYLTHFAGQGGAGKLFRADPGASARAVLGDRVVSANPFLDRMTAGDVIAWAHRKMDEPAPRRAGARTELAAGDDGAMFRDQLQREIDRIDAETDASRAASAADDPLGAVLDDAAARSVSVDGTFTAVDLGEADAPAPSPLPRDRAADRLSDREAGLLPLLRAEIAGKARLSDVTALAKRLDATADEIKLSLQRIAESDRSIIADKGGKFRRVPTDKGPVDAYKFLARAGGLTPHGLDVGVEYIPKGKLIGAEKNKGHDLIGLFNTKARSKSGGKRDQSILIPGAGPLIRNNGMSIDDAGEMLFGAGYLRGADGGRPTVAETIAYLEQGMADGPARLLPGDRAAELDVVSSPESIADMTEHMREWAAYQEADLDADDIDALARLMLRDDIENEDAALASLINDAVMDAMNDMRYESGDYDADFSQALDYFDAGNRVGGPAPDGRNAGEGGARGAPGDDRFEAGDGADFAEWDTGTGAIAAEQADSIIHDLDARDDLFGGATRDERRAALERRGDGGLSTGVEQKPAGGDGGLFDTAARGQTEMPTFILDDSGDARSWADIAAEITDDDIEIQALKDCL